MGTATEYTLELTWPQLRGSLHDGVHTAQLAKLFNSCEATMDEMDPTEKTVTIKVISPNGEEQYTLDRKNRVVEDLREEGLPAGRLVFMEKILDNSDTWGECGIEDGAVLTLTSMTRSDVKEEVDTIVRRLYNLDGNIGEYYNLNWYTEEEDDTEFTLDFSKKGVTGIPDVFGGLTVRSIKCEGCRKLTSVVIPGSVTSIGDNAFGYCRNLTSVAIPNSVTSIGEAAFFKCKELTSVTIPGSVTSIGGAAFTYCERLTSVTIPDSVKSIGNWAFAGCVSLTSVTIPEKVRVVGNAFDSNHIVDIRYK